MMKHSILNNEVTLYILFSLCQRDVYNNYSLRACLLLGNVSQVSDVAHGPLVFVLFVPTVVFYIVSSQNCMVVNYKKEGSVSCKLVHDPSLASDLSTYGSVVEQG